MFSLLNLIKQKASDALSGVENFVGNNVVKPVQQDIQAWATQNPQPAQQVLDTPNNLMKTLSDVIATVGKTPIINNPSPLPMPKVPTISQVPSILQNYKTPEVITQNVVKPLVEQAFPVLKAIDAFTGDKMIPFYDAITKTGLDSQVNSAGKTLEQVGRVATGQKYTGSPLEDVSNAAMVLPFGGVADVGGKGLVKVLGKVPEAVKAGETIIKDAAPVIKKTADLFGQKAGIFDKLSQSREFFAKQFGPQWDAVNATHFAPLDYAKASAVDFKNKYNGIISNLGISAGSKISKYVQMFGEGNVALPQLVNDLGSAQAQKVVAANDIFRQVYKSILTDVNTLRTKAGLPLIPERQDYFRHVSEMGGNFVDTLISGGARGEKSTSIFKQQTGKTPKPDAVKGFADYIERAAHAGFIEPQAKNFDNLAKTLADNPNAPVNLSRDIANFSNKQLRGVREPLSNNDVLNFVIGGADKVAKTIRANKIIGNITSVVAQSLNMPMIVADNGVRSSLNGLLKIGENWKVVANSPFIKDRAYSQPLNFSTGLNRVKGYGGKALQEADNIFAKISTSMYYENALSRGLKGKEALKWASDEARRTIGGRGVGDFSASQTSGLYQTFVPFTLEVQAGLQRLGHLVSEKQVGKVASYFVMTNGVNDAYQKAFGYRPLPDPIQTAIDMYQYAEGTDTKKQSWLKVFGRAVAGVTDFSPLAQNGLALGYTILSSLFKDANGNSYLPNSSEIFGSTDPTRFGGANMYVDPFLKPSTITGNRPLDIALNALFAFSPTGYGGQLKKTIAGIIADQKGYTQTATGKVEHPLSQDIVARIQTAIAGPWATDSSTKFFNNDYARALDNVQSELYKAASPADKQIIYDNAQSQNKNLQQMTDASTASALTAGGSTGSFWDKLTGNNQTPLFDKLPTTAKEKTAYNTMVDTALASGATVPDNALAQRYFDGKTYDTADDATQKNILDSILTVQKDQYLTDVQKQSIATASKVTPEDLTYYTKASMNAQDKLQGVITLVGSTDQADRSQLLATLAAEKRTVGGKALIDSTMVDYLYNAGTISKDEKAYLDAVKWDPIYKKFYMDRDYKGSGGGLTSAQKKAYMTAINSLNKNTISTKNAATAAKPKAVAVPKLTLGLKKGAKTANSWFTPY